MAYSVCIKSSRRTALVSSACEFDTRTQDVLHDLNGDSAANLCILPFISHFLSFRGNGIVENGILGNASRRNVMESFGQRYLHQRLQAIDRTTKTRKWRRIPRHVTCSCGCLYDVVTLQTLFPRMGVAPAAVSRFGDRPNSKQRGTEENTWQTVWKCSLLRSGGSSDADCTFTIAVHHYVPIASKVP